MKNIRLILRLKNDYELNPLLIWHIKSQHRSVLGLFLYFCVELYDNMTRKTSGSLILLPTSFPSQGVYLYHVSRSPLICWPLLPTLNLFKTEISSDSKRCSAVKHENATCASEFLKQLSLQFIRLDSFMGLESTHG